MQELKVISDFNEMHRWFINHTQNMPRSQRFSLGISMEDRLLKILEQLIRAKFSTDKAGFLKDANVELELLRFQVRLAVDVKAFPISSQEHATKLMYGVGSQIGTWMKNTAARK